MPSSRQGWTTLILTLLLNLNFPGAGSGAESMLSVPGPMIVFENGDLLAVACERTGEIRIVETGTGEIVSTRKAGDKISGLVSVTGGTQLLAAAAGPDELVFLSADRAPRILSKHPLPGPPGNLAVSEDNSRIAVTIPARRSVLIFRFEDSGIERLAETRLKFAPGLLQFLPDRRLVITDAFGGRIATVGADGQSSNTPATVTPFHNISGIALSPDSKRILISHQRGSSLARSSFDDLHWGSLMRNEISSSPVTARFSTAASIQPLSVGEVNDAAGDPAGIVVDSDWRIYVALAGVNQVGIFAPGNPDPERLDVGHRPRHLVLDEARNRLYAANSLSDSISVIETAKRAVIAEYRIAPEQPLTARDRGEQHFFDARLSHDGWISCHSCHTEGHSNGRLIDTLGDGAHGSPKRVLSLLGVRDTAPYAWNGSMPDLRTQISKTMESTMHGGEELTEAQTNDLAVFLESLDPPAERKTDIEDAESIDRGRKLFAGDLRCNRCHDPKSAYTSAKIYDVGMTDRAGNAEFNPPSLRGVGQRSFYFHDGRAETLKKVFSEHRHQLEERELTEEEMHGLLAFLRSL